MAHSSSRAKEKFHKIAATERRRATPEPEDDWDPIMAIGVAASMTGLSVSALRKYESEGLLTYHRTPTGRRLLCRADIRRIKTIQHLINEEGLNIEGIRRLLALLPCWDLTHCSQDTRRECLATKHSHQPCWMVRKTKCAKAGFNCNECDVYRYGTYCIGTMKSLVHGTDDDTP
ncbi:MAG: MerR family transcriptional regulator [candidate division Zixibacteria bacterium]|nr:MerR family transcriptional regulator [candidate division Zixibacteria bacterium]